MGWLNDSVTGRRDPGPTSFPGIFLFFRPFALLPLSSCGFLYAMGGQPPPLSGVNGPVAPRWIFFTNWYKVLGMSTFSHFDEDGASRMVDVGDKPETDRFARAVAAIRMGSETLTMIRDRRVQKGDVLGVARIAAIMAAKRTDELIPLCHALPITAVEIEFEYRSDEVLEVTSTVRTKGRTGVEMEALTAVSVAALTIYDMCKSVDRGMTVESIQLEEKWGGKSGHFQRASHRDAEGKQP